jgi:uncharacterized protein YukJ
MMMHAKGYAERAAQALQIMLHVITMENILTYSEGVANSFSKSYTQKIMNLAFGIRPCGLIYYRMNQEKLWIFATKSCINTDAMMAYDDEDEDEEINRQLALKNYFINDDYSKRSTLPKGGIIYCYVHIVTWV